MDPDKFPAYRPDQPQAVVEIVDCDKRFLVTAMPTGVGKSLIYVVASLLGGKRTLILTANKGLQKQLENDFGNLLVSISGKNNYVCPLNKLPCDMGPCVIGYKCPHKKTTYCPFWAKVEEAKDSNIVMTNYKFWLLNEKALLGHFDRLVCDEAHDSVINVLDALSTVLYHREFPSYWPTPDISVSECMEWVEDRLEDAKETLRELHEHTITSEIRKELFRLTRIKTKLEKLKDNYNATNWVIEHLGDRMRFDPIWPGALAEWYLFKGIEKVVMTSATVRPKTLYLLGVKTEEFIYHEYASRFPVSRRPVMIIPTTRVSYRWTKADMDIWMTRLEQIIRQRLDRKGIIHTVSYARRNYILDNSKFADIMMTHDSGDTRAVVEDFKNAEPPRILVSPSVVTGWDFPYDTCEYQILSKIPFPDMRLAVDRERKRIDKEYPEYLAMQQVIQAFGRGMRAPDDQCEGLITDDHAKWFLFGKKHLATKGFMDAVSIATTIPQPPGRIVK